MRAPLRIQTEADARSCIASVVEYLRRHDLPRTAGELSASLDLLVSQRAAAPDLWAALKIAQEILDRNGIQRPEIDAALAKAERTR